MVIYQLYQGSSIPDLGSRIPDLGYRIQAPEKFDAVFETCPMADLAQKVTWPTYVGSTTSFDPMRVVWLRVARM